MVRRGWSEIICTAALLCSIVASVTARADELGEHKQLLPLDAADWIAAACVAVAVCVAAGAGVGGGGILVPVFVMILGFDAKLAIPISNATIFGSAIVNTFYNAPKRSPVADKPLIDWDLMLVMQPATAGGALLGSFLNKIIPSVILVICLAAILSFTVVKTMKRGLRLHTQESARFRSAAAAAAADARVPHIDPVAMPELGLYMNPIDPKSPVDESASAEGLIPNEEISAPEVLAVAAAERKTGFWRPALLAAIVGLIAMLTTLSSTEFECGSIGFWALNALVVPLCVVSVWAIATHMIRRYKHKLAIAYPLTGRDIAWNFKKTTTIALLSVVAGLIAAMFGVGGGMIQGPLMLELGVHPAVASATSATLILYTSAVATVSYYLRGQLVLDYAIGMAIVGIIFTAVGQVGSQKLVEATGRQSIIIFLIATIIVVSTVLLTYVGVANLVQDPGAALEASGICT